MAIKYSSFVDENEIIQKIRENKHNIESLLSKKLTFQEVITTAVGSNTYRAFRSNGITRPCNVFREWALSVLGQEDEAKSKLCVETKSELDTLFCFLSNDLLKIWNSRLTGMTIFKSRKMISLLLKNFCFWDKFSDAELKIYIKQIPLPLDSRTISAIRLPYNRTGKYKIPTNVTMKFIDEEEKYAELQNYFQYLADKAQVPVIFLDYLYYIFQY